jgi:hypothetical protein
MRILAATQSADLANESECIKHGLLSYALVEEGIKQRRAVQNGQVTLRDWLKYGVTEVPDLYKRIVNRDPKLVCEKQASLKPKAGGSVGDDSSESGYQQQPSLFDFARKRTDVMLLKASASH